MGWGINQYALQKVPVKKPCNGYYLRWYYNGFHYWFFQPGKYSVVTEGEKYYTIGTRKVTMGSGQVTRGQAQGMRTIMMTREVSLLTIAGWMSIRIEPGSLVVYDNKLAGAEIEFNAIIGSKEISYTTGFTPVPIIPVIPPDATSCEIIIGSQVWMCKNFDSNYPGSKVYDDSEAYRAIYGGLYTHDQIMSPGFCPVGWHVPTLVEWQTLITYLSALPGKKLKEIGNIHWNPPSAGTNDYGFTALGAGIYFPPLGYIYLLQEALFWTADAYSIQLRWDNDAISILGGLNNNYYSVRLIKDTPAPIYNDWFMPSKDELQAIYNELQLHGLGGFVLGRYLSSSENDADTVWRLGFDGSGSSTTFKSSGDYVRACRAFTSVSLLYSLRDIGPAGGLIFWKSGNNYLEVAPTDCPIIWWSNVIHLLIGTTGTAIGTGLTNTNAIISQPGHIDSAAKRCKDLIYL